ncbi:haloacid dehalogenase-like hydrolase [Jiella endophytica]|uniref:Haloacid dehalogenase-like hydrolase n=1 Tax=Jiella endophytica TaxID=2558362 RepID=A0A4Y8RQ88_9HYPH|nr:HAD family hydrolase [Jiella endophytica]TFF24847.1 haloacid dehalogenase-like hydrolase [Jiella endophytica]
MKVLSGLIFFLAISLLPAAGDPLPSWNDTASKASIVAFVEKVSDPQSPDYVPQELRIATFDNDGTLWSEKPLYFQALYAFDRLQEKAKADPGILTSDVLKAAAAGDMKGAMAGGDKGLIDIVNVSHSGLTVEDFETDVKTWLTTATHPTSGRIYADMIYQPMVELLAYLRDRGFSTYIVSGGGVHFIRAISQEAYNVPPQQVVGSEGATNYSLVDGKPTLMKEGGLQFLDDKAGKPVGIDRHIGRRPIFVAGNSDGDLQMLEWATAGEGPRLGLFVHHTDAKREFAYDRDSSVGRLSDGLDAAGGKGWLLVDMAKDWAVIWPGKQ